MNTDAATRIPTDNAGGAKPRSARPRCPFVGLADDPATAVALPSPANCCHARQPIAPASTGRQEQFCLTADYPDCPVFQRVLAAQQNGGLPPSDDAEQDAPPPQSTTTGLLVTAFIVILLLAAAVIWWPSPGSSTLDGSVLAEPPQTTPLANSAAVAAVPSPTLRPTDVPPTATPTRAATAVPTAAPTTAAPPAAFIGPQEAAERAILIRTEPTAAAGVVLLLTSRERVTLLGRDDSNAWLKVRFDDGQEGWIEAGQAQVNLPPTALPILPATTSPTAAR